MSEQEGNEPTKCEPGLEMGTSYVSRDGTHVKLTWTKHDAWIVFSFLIHTIIVDVLTVWFGFDEPHMSVILRYIQAFF